MGVRPGSDDAQVLNADRRLGAAAGCDWLWVNPAQIILYVPGGMACDALAIWDAGPLESVARARPAAAETLRCGHDLVFCGESSVMTCPLPDGASLWCCVQSSGRACPAVPMGACWSTGR
jgi:hypothetical protein